MSGSGRPAPVSFDEAIARARWTSASSAGYVQDALAVDFRRTRPLGTSTTPAATLPDPAPWAGRLARAILEVMSGTRNAPQLVRFTTPDVYAVVARRGALAARRAATIASPTAVGSTTRPRVTRLPVVVRRVFVCEPAPGIAEATVIVGHGPRVRALAMRLSAHDGKWRVEALEIG